LCKKSNDAMRIVCDMSLLGTARGFRLAGVLADVTGRREQSDAAKSSGASHDLADLQFADHLLEHTTFVHGPLSLFAQVSDLVAAGTGLDENGQRRGGRHVGQLLQPSAR
jgi:hypothetical protein